MKKTKDRFDIQVREKKRELQQVQARAIEKRDMIF